MCSATRSTHRVSDTLRAQPHTPATHHHASLRHGATHHYTTTRISQLAWDVIALKDAKDSKESELRHNNARRLGAARRFARNA